MMVRCVSEKSWADAIVGACDAILVSKMVRKGARFCVYVGKRRLPRLVDARNKFVCLGCVRFTQGVYVCKIRVERAKSV